jgi:formylglycine-generating enzyme required for sulfatase activity
VQETAEWGAVAASTDRGAIEAFLKQWPNGQHTGAARARIAELRRGAGGLRRGILLGAGATGVLAIAIVGVYLMREQVYWLTQVRPYVLTPEREQALKPGNSFRECAKDCPEMVVVPAGEFMMGLPTTEKGRIGDEGPQHKVAIAKRFAVSKFDVTFADWDACVSARGCPQVGDSGYGRGTNPVINVSWDDAQQYVAWFSKMTGRPYRLLTEAEWEYAARAGSTTAYFWGNDIGKGNANCAGCGSQWGRPADFAALAKI